MTLPKKEWRTLNKQRVRHFFFTELFDIGNSRKQDITNRELILDSNAFYQRTIHKTMLSVEPTFPHYDFVPRSHIYLDDVLYSYVLLVFRTYNRQAYEFYPKMNI